MLPCYPFILALDVSFFLAFDSLFLCFLLCFGTRRFDSLFLYFLLCFGTRRSGFLFPYFLLSFLICRSGPPSGCPSLAHVPRPKIISRTRPVVVIKPTHYTFVMLLYAGEYLKNMNNLFRSRLHFIRCTWHNQTLKTLHPSQHAPHLLDLHLHLPPPINLRCPNKSTTNRHPLPYEKSTDHSGFGDSFRICRT